MESPTNVSVQATSNASAVVQWDYKGQNVSEFEVRFIPQPPVGLGKTEKWSIRTITDPSVRHLHIHHLNPGTPYAFCVSAIRGGRQGPCSDPPVAIDRLNPTHVVSKLQVKYKTANSVQLCWTYNGPQPVRFYIRYSGNKSYTDNNGKYYENNILPIEKTVDKTDNEYLLTELRPDMKYTIQVGVRDEARTYFPSEIVVKTKCRASPMVDPPRFIESKDANTASLLLGLASEEYGPISHYWLIVVPGNFTMDGFDYIESSDLKRVSDFQESASSLISPISRNKRKAKRARKHKRHFSRQTNLSGVYVTANFTADDVKAKKRRNESFLLGDGERYGGFLNQRLESNTQYRVLMRAFTKEFEENGHLIPLQHSKEKLEADSAPSPPFSTQSFYSIREGKASNLWLVAPLVAFLLVALIIFMLLLWLRWQRCSRKGSSHGSNRHTSITKVAIGNTIPSETSKLLSSEAYGRQIMNPYDQTNSGGGCLMEPTMDLYPMRQSVNFTAAPNGISMLPSSGGVLGGHTLTHPPIPICELATHIEKLKMNNNALFSQEYESIETGQPFKWESSILPSNKSKNRYANVVAYDHSRVELSILNDDPSTDYINANYIDGYEKAKAYIATQGPLPETFADFWRMIWEQNSATIVMLTRLEERSRVKCDQYWPSRGTSTYGNISVTLDDTLELAHYTIRTFRLQYRGINEKREVRHLQYTAWPDHGVPEKPTPFLMFLKRVKTLNPRKAGPIVTHCSAGIGRTGAFIAIDCMLERLRYENTVDIFGCVTALRSQRSYMVQTDDQYIFIHDAVLDAAQSGSTEVPLAKLRTHIQRLLQSESIEQTSGLEQEFRHLATLKMVNSRCAVANLQINRAKNRLVNMVPYDSTRVLLKEIDGVSGSDYINASWIDGYRQRNAYIATQGPMPNTAVDFWRMIWEYESGIIVMLVQVRESGREKCCEYWPVGSGDQFGDLGVEPIAEYSMSQYILREFRVTDTTSGQSRNVRHFQYKDWPENGVPKSIEPFIEFIHQVHRTKDQFGIMGPITVHCSTGAGRTGVFIALSIIIDRMRYETIVDVFTTVKLLRTERQNMVQDKDQYRFCYEAALEFYETSDNSYQT